MTSNGDTHSSSTDVVDIDIEKQQESIDRRESLLRDNKVEARTRGDNEDSSCSGGEIEGDNGDEDESEDEGEDNGPSVMDRVLSRVTSKSSVDPGPPPDGGWKAWGVCKFLSLSVSKLQLTDLLQGFGAHLVITNTWQVSSSQRFPLLSYCANKTA